MYLIYSYCLKQRQARARAHRRQNVHNYVVDEVKYERDWARDCSAIAIGAFD